MTPTRRPRRSPRRALNGVIGAVGDVDLYTFKATKGQTYDVRVFARQIRSPLDSVLAIAAAGRAPGCGQRRQRRPRQAARGSTTVSKDGEFVVSVADHLKGGGPDYAYRVEISPVVPLRLSLSTPNGYPLRRGTGTMAVAVPRGNRQAILINAACADFGGALSLAAAGLPAGVEFEADVLAAGTAVVPVLFSGRGRRRPGGRDPGPGDHGQAGRLHA